MKKITLEHIAPYLPYGLKVLVNTFYNTPQNEPLDKNVNLGAVLAIFDSVNRSENQWIGITFAKHYGLVGINTMFNKQWRVYKDFYTPERVKPILRPMSQLTETIIVDGKEVVPIVELFNLALFQVYAYVPEYTIKLYAFEEPTSGIVATFEGNRYGFTFDCDLDNNWIEFSLTYNGSNLKINQAALFQWLFKHHFDVFGLIPAGLAIDVNTLTENPYK